jgi:hypothetical protein
VAAALALAGALAVAPAAGANDELATAAEMTGLAGHVDTTPTRRSVGAAQTVERRVTIAYSPSRRRFHGQLRSGGSQSCVADQLVVVERATRGPNPVVAMVTTSTAGQWRVARRFRPGPAYVARVAAVTIPDVGVCGAATSRKIKRVP